MRGVDCGDAGPEKAESKASSQRHSRSRPGRPGLLLGGRDLPEPGLCTASRWGRLWGHGPGSGPTSLPSCAVLCTGLFTSLTPHSSAVRGSYPGGEGKRVWGASAPTGLPGRAACGHPVSSLGLCGPAWRVATLSVSRRLRIPKR